MFVLSLNKKTIKRFLLGALAGLILLILLIFLLGGNNVQKVANSESAGEYSLLAKSRSDIDDFLLQFGYETNNSTVVEEEVIIPKEFNDVYTKYNDLQKSQGLDLTKYKGKTAKQYKIAVSKASQHSEEDGAAQQLFAVLLTHDGYIIGGHLETGLQDCELLPFCDDAASATSSNADN